MEGSFLFPSISTLEDETVGWHMGLPSPGTPKVTFYRRVFPASARGCPVPCSFDTWPCLPLPGYLPLHTLSRWGTGWGREAGGQRQWVHPALSCTAERGAGTGRHAPALSCTVGRREVTGCHAPSSELHCGEGSSDRVPRASNTSCTTSFLMATDLLISTDTVPCQVWGLPFLRAGSK